MSTEQFQALKQQAQRLSQEERLQLLKYLAESELAEREQSAGAAPEASIDYVAFFGSGRGAFATADDADRFIRQERDAWENRAAIWPN